MPGASSRLRLRVAPGARQSAIVGRHGDAWKIRVSSAAERGRANDEVVAIIADAVGISRAAVRLVAGGSGRDKIVELQGIEQAETERRLQRAARLPTAGVA